MKLAKVVICMSTYNGEKYLREQIESILSQTYTNFLLFIRDDGSTDNTVNILKSYRKDKRVKLFFGDNLGYIESFIYLLNKAIPYGDYFAFSDQDDVWSSNKIERAITKLEHENSSSPLLYFSSHNVCDENLNIQYTPKINSNFIRFDSSIVENIPCGMEMVLNKKLAKLVCTKNAAMMSDHDWWVYIVATGLGKILYEDIPLVKYRRLNNNASFCGETGLKLQISRIKKFILGGHFRKIKNQILYYKKCYIDALPEENKKFINLFSEKYNFLNAFKKTFYPKRLRQKLSDEIVVRTLFLLGVL